jgi:protein downstream neighbor of Son
MLIPNNLKSSVETSGLTSYVRCIDIKNTTSGLDISDSAQFIQNLMYWQYPHLPWLNLVQRNSSSNNQYKLEQAESDELIRDWTESFNNLFQLLRARQCPYFYVIANNFSILFRAAGISGKVEMHALVTPTTKGLRQMLKDEDIELTQPLKKNSRSSTEGENKDPDEDDEEEDEEDEMTFLESLGVKTSDIKFKQDIKARQKEIEDDNGDVSTALIEGVDCQALFNFLLNAKSTIPKVGRLAGVPPTLISPVGFLGGTLRKQTMKSSKLKQDGSDYFSIELLGAIMPHTLHMMTNLLSDIKEEFSLTMSNYINTIAFTKASKKLIEDLDSSQAFADHVFGRENLSDCGIPQEVVESMCRVDNDAVNILERLQYNKEQGGFTFL